MSSRLLLVLLVLAVVVAGLGTALILRGTLFGAARFGWTAYAPLSGSFYRPVDPTWLEWAPRLGTTLLALGAGTSGAVVAVLVARRAASRSPQTHEEE